MHLAEPQLPAVSNEQTSLSHSSAQLGLLKLTAKHKEKYQHLQLHTQMYPQLVKKKVFGPVFPSYSCRGLVISLVIE